jgi:hypothetical protein
MGTDVPVFVADGEAPARRVKQSPFYLVTILSYTRTAYGTPRVFLHPSYQTLKIINFIEKLLFLLLFLAIVAVYRALWIVFLQL